MIGRSNSRQRMSWDSREGRDSPLYHLYMVCSTVIPVISMISRIEYPLSRMQCLMFAPVFSMSMESGIRFTGYFLLAIFDMISPRGMLIQAAELIDWLRH